MKSFLQLCVSFSRLKLLNLKYGNIKVDIQADSGCDVYDFSAILPCLSEEQWTTLAAKVKDEGTVLLVR